MYSIRVESEIDKSNKVSKEEEATEIQSKTIANFGEVEEN